MRNEERGETYRRIGAVDGLFANVKTFLISAQSEISI
jgi:hypothetical protein